MSTIGIALIGVGKIATDQHWPAIVGDPRFNLAATADRNGSGMDGIPHFADLNSLLAARNGGAAIDAIALCTPPQVRTQLAREAIDAGLHVLLEKPPAATIEDLDDLSARAASCGVTLFAAWHSRHAPMVAAAKAWLADRTLAGGSISWREDVRRWHPGQTWLWAAGGLGVFDPGINAFSILTELLPTTPAVRDARLEIPANAETPIAAQLTLTAGTAEIAVDLDFLQQGPQTWDIVLETTDGGRLVLSEGGSVMTIDDGAPVRASDAAQSGEYPGVYAYFASLIAAGASDADGAPLKLVADALRIGETHRVAPFIE